MSADHDGSTLPSAVLRSARAMGDVGARWLEDLPGVLRALEARWDVRIGRPLPGGSTAYVAPAEGGDGRPTVVKVALPDGLEGHIPFDTGLRATRLGQGRGYVDLLAVAEEHRALHLERLGPSLRTRHLAVDATIDVVVDTLRPVWVAPPAEPGLRTGREQAGWLAGFITTHWERLGRPCPRSTVRAALDAAGDRAAAFDAGAAVLIHGDAHPSNVLEELDTPPASPRYKLIDPDGMVSEPAHDLGVLLREWNDELCAVPEPADLLGAWCARAAGRAGVDPLAVWQWAYVERVSTGLFLCALGDAGGLAFLEMATRCAAAVPN
jgi:streptomycin 6-kinase